MGASKSMDVSNSRANNTKTLAIAWEASKNMDKGKSMDVSKGRANNKKTLARGASNGQHGQGQEHGLQ